MLFFPSTFSQYCSICFFIRSSHAFPFSSRILILPYTGRYYIKWHGNSRPRPKWSLSLPFPYMTDSNVMQQVVDLILCIDSMSVSSILVFKYVATLPNKVTISKLNIYRACDIAWWHKCNATSCRSDLIHWTASMSSIWCLCLIQHCQARWPFWS